GQGDAGLVLRPGRTRRGARGHRRAPVRRCVGGRVLLDRARRHFSGIRLMDAAAPAGRPTAGQEFFERAGVRLTLAGPPGLTDPSVVPKRGDHDLDPVMRAIAEVRPIRPAAVLVPVIDRPEPAVLLTKRTAELPDHAGQVAFPGGKIDTGDASPLAAA